MDALKDQDWAAIAGSKPFAAALGLVTHSILSHGEPDYKFHVILTLWAIATGSIVYVVYLTNENVKAVSEALLFTAPLLATYFGTIFASMLIYRGFFHRLRHFPGPFLARFSKFYNITLVLPGSQYFRSAEKMHQKYGDYVRLGPRELSIADADAVPAVHGPSTKCSKGPWYGAVYHVEGASLHTTRSKLDHKERRRIWDRAFNAKSLRDYQPRIQRHTQALINQLRLHQNETLRFSNWINWFAFDVMGDIGFSRSFGMVEKGEEDDVIKQLHKSMAPLAIFSHISWMMNLLLRIPKGAEDMMTFIRWTHDVLVDRKKRQPAEKDVFSWLIDDTKDEIPLSLNADTRLMIVAGSDTTSATLIWLFYELCLHPEEQRKLQKVIDEIANGSNIIDCDSLTNAPHIDGCINEALRLHPPVPSGVQRETPPEGITIKDRFIPGNTLIWMPIHTMQRDARYFPEPLKFMPERWTTQPEMIQDRRAFMPFSIGTYGCIGQKMAMIEMRNVTANILRNFDVKFAPAEDGKCLHNDTMDCFTLAIGKLDVVLTPRNL